MINNTLGINCQELKEKAPKGTYLEVKLIINNNETHYKALKRLSFRKRTLTYLNKISRFDDRLELSFISEIPEYVSKEKLYNLDSEAKLGNFYQDLFDTRFDGDSMTTFNYLEEAIEFKLPNVETKYDLSWTLPESVFWDLLDNITLLSNIALTEGFEEAYVSGPYLLEIK